MSTLPWSGPSSFVGRWTSIFCRQLWCIWLRAVFNSWSDCSPFRYVNQKRPTRWMWLEFGICSTYWTHAWIYEWHPSLIKFLLCAQLTNTFYEIDTYTSLLSWLSCDSLKLCSEICKFLGRERYPKRFPPYKLLFILYFSWQTTSQEPDRSRYFLAICSCNLWIKWKIFKHNECFLNWLPLGRIFRCVDIDSTLQWDRWYITSSHTPSKGFL